MMKPSQLLFLYHLFICVTIASSGGSPILNSHVVRPSLVPHQPAFELDPFFNITADLNKAQNFGIALAGGGTRGAAIAHGATRALRDAGLLEEARYLSLTSGSIWFGVPMYHQQKDSLDVFLGTSMPPQSLSLENLTDSAIAGSFVTRCYSADGKLFDLQRRSLRDEQEETTTVGKLEKWAVEHAESCLADLCSCAVNLVPNGSLHELWNLAVGWKFLRPFDLAQRDSIFAHESQVRRVRREVGEHVRIHATRTKSQRLPFLITQSSVLALDSGSDQASDPLLSYAIESSSLLHGVPVSSRGAAAGSYRGMGDVMVEPFAASSAARSPLPRSSSGSMRVQQRLNALNFGALSSWAGIGTCYAADFQGSAQYQKAPKCEKSAMEKILPYASMWSPNDVDDKGIPITKEVPVGDAGIFDDIGHLPLLRRRVPKMLIYDSSAIHSNITGVDKEHLHEMVYLFAAFGQVGGLPPGYPPGSPNPYLANHSMTVFEPSEFAALFAKVQALHRAGEPVVVRDHFTVVDNPLWGVVGGWKVEIVWVLLLPVRAWRDALPAGTAAKLPSYFPNYLASEVNSQVQTSALSQYSSWVTEKAVIREVKTMLEQ